MTTIPKKSLVALPDFNNPTSFKIVPPEEAFIPFFDRSFHFGDSLYEVIRTYNGILFSLDDHLNRLTESLRLAMFEELPNLNLLRTMIYQTTKTFFQKFGNSDVYIRVTVVRGQGDTNIDTSYSSSHYMTVYVKELKNVSTSDYEKGIHAVIVNRIRNHPDALPPAMKSGNYLNNILALSEAKNNSTPNNKIDDAIMINTQGFITELTTSNFFTVLNNQIITAPLSTGILEGITRKWLFEIASKANIPLTEKLFTATDIRSANELFLTSTLKEVMPITQLNGNVINGGKPGPITNKLKALFTEFIKNSVLTKTSESLYI